MTLALRPQVHAGRVRHQAGQTDRRPHRRGRAVGTPAGTIRMPSVSRSGSRAADGHQSRIIQRARTRQARARECRGGTGCRSPGRQGAGRCGRPDRPSSYSGITLSDEGRLKRTHADPPLCAAFGRSYSLGVAAHNWAFCTHGRRRQGDPARAVADAVCRCSSVGWLGGDEVQECARGYRCLAFEAGLVVGQQPVEVGGGPGVQVGAGRFSGSRSWASAIRLTRCGKGGLPAGSVRYFCTVRASWKWRHSTPYSSGPIQYR